MNRFWEHKPLTDMTAAEWESLCDGCGKCCLHKLVEGKEHEEEPIQVQPDDVLHYVNVHCRYLDTHNGGCKCYSQRLQVVPDCVDITVADLPNIHFMPPSCAYRRLYEDRGLPDWHPLLHNGSRAAMVEAGMAVTGHQVYSDKYVSAEDPGALIVSWPLDDVK